MKSQSRSVFRLPTHFPSKQNTASRLKAASPLSSSAGAMLMKYTFFT